MPLKMLSGAFLQAISRQDHYNVASLHKERRPFRMDKKFWFQFIGLTIVILGAAALTFNQGWLRMFTGSVGKNTSSANQSVTKKTAEILDNAGNVKASFAIEVADTAEKRSKGLGYRDNLATNSGMLFIHDKPQKYTYWMKGMRFPIDIIWIRDNQIVDIIANIPIPIEGQTDETLEKYAPITEANRVLELNAGEAELNNIQKGDKIVITN